GGRPPPAPLPGRGGAGGPPPRRGGGHARPASLGGVPRGGVDAAPRRGDLPPGALEGRLRPPGRGRARRDPAARAAPGRGGGAGREGRGEGGGLSQGVRPLRGARGGSAGGGGAG